MGKQSRRKRERPPGEAKAQRYLARLGLPERPDPGPYRRLAAADPAWFRAVCEADDTVVALAERGAEGDPAEYLAATQARYALLYRDLDTALAEYASRPVMIAAPWLRWWLEHHPPGNRLLDVGCGPGVLTCAYALAMPEGEVIGVDAVPEAVACAEALAARLGVRNVSFVVGDCRAAPGDDALGAFDQLVAVTALGDAGLYPQHPPPGPDPFSTVADVDGPGAAFRSPGVESAVAHLSGGGAVLAFDRTPDASQAVRFGAALVHAGVDLDLRQAGVELFVEEGQPVTFTRFAGRLSATAAPATTAADLAGWIKSQPPPAYGQPWHDELRFRALQAAGARRVWGCEIDYAPHSPVLERREIWSLGDDVYGFVTTTLGLRELTSGRSPEDLWREYANYAARFVTSGLTVRFFDV
ncbi:MAG TPA: methyltransferase domain-containing protein [Acidimicrobiia bacterium]|nr:methyltransferase domain-containing protein [Acidimicrobiia bacterium]